MNIKCDFLKLTFVFIESDNDNIIYTYIYIYEYFLEMFYNKAYSRNVRQREKVDLTFCGEENMEGVLIKQYQMILYRNLVYHPKWQRYHQHNF